ncbi:MAG TPA: helix-turn-helix domain-containing protein [Pseudomonadales bacterium]|nr:helix-turn-helix domain-containing protein [Pseudomonadales bacterium]
MNSTLNRNRLDPAEFNNRDQKSLERLNDALVGIRGRPSLCVKSEQIELPEPLFKLLKRIALSLKEGKPVILIPETENLTTQAAANLLGISRPYLIQLLNDKKIPYHRVGTHRRLYLKDINRFMHERDHARHDALDKLSDAVEKAGLYEGAAHDDSR